MISRLFSYALNGLDGFKIDVEVDIARGVLPAYDTVGLPDAAVKESRERVRAALKSLDIALLDHLIVGRNAVYSCLAETVIVLHAEEFETIPPEVYREEYLSPIKKPLLAVVMEQYQE